MSSLNTMQCAYFSGFNLAAFFNSQLSLSLPTKPVYAAVLNQCLCSGDTNDFININAIAAQAIAQTNSDSVLAALLTAINDQSGSTLCTYQHGVTPACSRTNVCAFTCPNDFSPSGSQCVCNGPKVVCSTGQCAAACPSDTPSKRSIAEQYRMGQVFCPHGQVPCGGATGPKSYECIDTRRTLDSCGGCVLPLHGIKPSGRDCSAIPGVRNVQCQRSKCVVRSCMSGWHVTEDAGACMPSTNCQ